MSRVKALIASVIAAVALVPIAALPAQAEPVCVYDSLGKRVCVSENGAEIPEGPLWFCVIYTFSGGQICASSDGQIAENP